MSIDEIVTDLLLQWEDKPALTAEALSQSYADQPFHADLLAAVKRGMSRLRAVPFQQSQSTSQAAPAQTPPTRPNSDEAAQQIQWHAPGLRYRPKAFHAKGGLGEVFRATDEELQREVALKRIQHRHQDSAESRRRFLVEAKITSQLEHPGIVPVHGLVRDADGNPCYAMRFIQGQTLEEAIRQFHDADKDPKRDGSERSLALRELLSRVIAVCNTMAYAHSRGFLHRDLKPGNIILGSYGETLVVDWGLAKAFIRPGEVMPADNNVPLAVPATGEEHATHLGRLMGTPAYMSPEQAHGRWDVVGPSSDVFSLGATFYALLTGQAPYQARDKEAVLEKARKGDFLPARQVCAKVPRDLEMICRKCMAKDPSQRYDSAKALAEDVQRWLADEPVKAYREPLTQRGRRWLRKHRTLVGSSVAAVLVTAVCLGGATALLGDAYEQEHVAKVQKEEQLLAATAAEKAARTAEATAKLAKQQSDTVTQFLVTAFRSPDPEVQGVDLKVVDVLDGAVTKLQAEATDDPLLKARLLAAIGETYLGLKEGKKAVPVFEQERQLRMHLGGLNHEDTVNAMNNLGLSYILAGRYEEAVTLLEKTLMLKKANLGDKDPETLRSKHNLAAAYEAAGRPKEAANLHEEILNLKLGKNNADDPAVLEVKDILAIAYSSLGRMTDALPLLEEILAIRRIKLGNSHPALSTCVRLLLKEAGS